MTSPAPGHTPPKLTATPPAAKPSPLCLACASSLPPRLSPSAIFQTQCCARPICPACLERKPRLAQYNPCLLCQSGVGASASGLNGSTKDSKTKEVMKDADAYIIGKDEDDSDEESPPAYTDGSGSSEAPSAVSSLPSSPSPPAPSDPTPSSAAGPRTYYLKPNDTLSSLALRFQVPARTLCTFNRLPPATLSTQPHLLHTRSSISIPPPSGAPTGGLNTLVFDADAEEESEDVKKERERMRARERAAVKLATLTKQDDPNIVRAYVALAEDEGAGEGGEAEYERIRKAKEAGRSAKDVVGLEGAVVDQYLEDEEWEADMRRRGLGPGLKSRQSLGKAQ